MAFGCSRSTRILCRPMVTTRERPLSPLLNFLVARAKVKWSSSRVVRPFAAKSATGSNGSAASVRLFGLLTYRVHRMLIRATRRLATALEMARVRVVVGLRRLYFETGHGLGDFLIARMTGHGRERESRAVPVS